MARRFLDDVRSDMAALYVAGGGIAAVNEGALMLDLLDSVIQDECVIYGATVIEDEDTTATFTPIDVGYDTTVGGDAVFLKANAASGEIQTATTAGFTYSIRGQITVIASNGQAIEFCILRNGVDVMGPIGGVTGDGGGDPVGITVFGSQLSAPSDAVYAIGIRTPAGANTVDIQSLGLQVTIQPTNNP